MKKILLLTMGLAAAALSLHAQNNTLTVSAGGLKKLRLGDGLKVTLVNTPGLSGETKGNTALFAKLDVSVSQGMLHIDANKGLKQDEEITVLVDGLESLTVGSETRVTTQGSLPARPMTVFVEDGAVARLRTEGKVSVFATDDSQVSVKKEKVVLNVKGSVL